MRVEREPSWRHPRPSCHAAIVAGGRLVLIQRAHEPFQGWWGLPGGAVELGETVKEALEREVREETGLEITPGRFLALRDAIGRDQTSGIRYHYVILFFQAELLGGELRAGDDAARAEWVGREELRRYNLVPGIEDVIHMAWDS